MTDIDLQNYTQYTKSIRNLGTATVELNQVGLSVLDIAEDVMIDDQSDAHEITIVEECEFAKTWETIHNLIAKYTDKQSQSETKRVDYSGAEDVEICNTTTGEIYTENQCVGTLKTAYFNTGELFINCEVIATDGHNQAQTLFSGLLPGTSIDPVSMGRQIARIELASLVHITGSSAVALDYWMTEQDGGWYQQVDWATSRGVNRQTVSDNVRSAKEDLSRRT